MPRCCRKPSGNLFACNYQRAGTIGKVTAAGEVSVYAEMPAGGRSAGLHFDRNRDLIALDYINHLVYRMDASRAAFLEVLTRDWTGPAFRQPNDLTVAPDSSVYFSDPDWSSSGGGRVFLFLATDDFAARQAELERRGVRFLEAPRSEPYGRVAVFEDLYGNRWDLVEAQGP